MLLAKIFKINGSCRRVQFVQRAFYSRKSSSKFSGSYKVVNKAQDEANEMKWQKFDSNANWELFSPHGFRFYMPGSVGPAWHDSISTALMPTTMEESDGAELECIVQDCPMLLRQGVNELFPGTDTSNSPLTVVTLSQKAERLGSESEVERLTKQFMWAAQDICGKLKMAGYWADFINPFSGLPYLSVFNRPKLYKTDERFRCLGFHILHHGPCRVISNKTNQKFVGSLFTTAPASMSLLHEILQDYDCP